MNRIFAVFALILAEKRRKALNRSNPTSFLKKKKNLA